MQRAALVAMSLVVAMPCFAEVRVITGDVDYVYGPGGKVLDDADLLARNQRAWEHMQAEKQLAIESQQVEVEIERLKLQQMAIASGMAQDWDGTAPSWNSTDGGWFIGSTPAPRKGLSHRIGVSPRIGISRRRWS